MGSDKVDILSFLLEATPAELRCFGDLVEADPQVTAKCRELVCLVRVMADARDVNWRTTGLHFEPIEQSGAD